MKKLDTTRAKIADVIAQLSAPDVTGPSHAELTADVREQLEALADKGAGLFADGVTQVAQGGMFAPLSEPIEYAGSHKSIPDRSDRLAAALSVIQDSMISRAERATALIVYAVGVDVVLAKFAPALQDMPDALDAETRAQRTAELNRDLEVLERDEELIIRQIEAAGGEWDPRPGQRPQFAVLIEGDDV